MKVQTSNKPTVDAASKIVDELQQHPNKNFIFLAGGSALQIAEELSASMDSNLKGRTIFMLGDERWSRRVDENNFLQLQNTLPENHGLDIIATLPENHETHEAFVNRLNQTTKNIFLNEQKIFCLAVLGIGTDGHTASIFPMSKESFTATYKTDYTYVPVVAEGLRIDHRASLTPSFILEHIDQVVGYAVGTDKQNVVAKLINETKPINEMPIQLIKQHTHATLFTDIII